MEPETVVIQLRVYIYICIIIYIYIVKYNVYIDLNMELQHGPVEKEIPFQTFSHSLVSYLNHS